MLGAFHETRRAYPSGLLDGERHAGRAVETQSVPDLRLIVPGLRLCCTGAGDQWVSMMFLRWAAHEPRGIAFRWCGYDAERG